MAPRVPGLSRLAVSNPRIGLHSLSRTSCGRLVLRTASTTSSSQPPPSNPRVLEQPTRFNPPSHGSRLPRSGGGRSADQGAAVPPPKHYGPALSAAEKEALDSREYPGLPPPPGSWASWFINSRWIHLCLTLLPLAILGLYTARASFLATSPYADLIPPFWPEFFQGPLVYLRTVSAVVHLHDMHNTALVRAKRLGENADVEKRRLYRKAHGIPEKRLFGLWNVYTEEEAKEKEAAASADGSGSGEGGRVTDDGLARAAARIDGLAGEARVEAKAKAAFEERKKWFGLF